MHSRANSSYCITLHFLPFRALKLSHSIVGCILQIRMRTDRFGLIENERKDEERYYELLRRASPSEKLRLVIAHMRLARRLQEVGRELRAKPNDLPGSGGIGGADDGK